MRMKVVAGGGACVGIAAEGYDVERRDEMWASTAEVLLDNGSTVIHPDISEDGEFHFHHGLLKDYIPKTLPYDLALRINKDGNMPQLRFNEDGEWHDFAPEGGTGLKAGPWFPYLTLSKDARLSDHRVNRPRAVKSAGKINKAPAAASSAAADGAGAEQKAHHEEGAGAGAAADGEEDDSVQPPQKKTRVAEPVPTAVPESISWFNAFINWSHGKLFSI